jgi:ribose transport system substrate-binding protein
MKPRNNPAGTRHRRIVVLGVVLAGVFVATLATAATPPPKITAKMLIASAGRVDSNWFCGTKKITLGISDGFGTNSWSQASMAAVRSEAAKCPNVTQKPAIAQGSLQKAISDMNTFVTLGVNAVVINPSFGAAQLPSLRSAMKAGVKVVVWANDLPQGKQGVDYITKVNTDQEYTAYAWGVWMKKALHGKGNVVFLGGPPNNTGDIQTINGFRRGIKGSQIKMLTGNGSWANTTWTTGTGQKTMSALLARYPEIDGVLTDYGATAVGAIRAFQAAHRTLVPFATSSENDLGCLYKQLTKSNPGLQIGTGTTRSWVGRVAARKAIAAAEGIPDPEPSFMKVGNSEDSISGPQPKCDPRFAPDADLTSQLTKAELAKYGKVQ